MLGLAVPVAGLRPGAALPASLAAWLRHMNRRAPAGASLTLAREARRYALRALPALEGQGWLLYVGERAAGTTMTVSQPPASTSADAMLTLSRREREVLDWVSAGKSDTQAAAILGISVRTVQKHLEHVYVKLGVEGRTAAAMRVRDAQRGTRV